MPELNISLVNSEALDGWNGLSRIKTKFAQNGSPMIRYSLFVNQLKRIALQYDMQLSSRAMITESDHRTFVWRLTSECFAVQISYLKCAPPADYDSSSGSVSVEDFVVIIGVEFEYNHDKVMPCSDLLADLNLGKFDSLCEHVNNLVTVYAVPGNKIDRARAYMCLEAMEQDLSMLSQVQQFIDSNPEHLAKTTFPSLASLRQQQQQHQMSSAGDVFAMQQFVNQSVVGHFRSRTGGRLAQLTYLVTPAQAAVYRATVSSVNATEKPVYRSTSVVGRGSADGLLGGFVARVGLRSSVPFAGSNLQQLAFMPLVTIQEDAHGNRVPDFAQPNDINCIAIEAEFVLYLDPPIPMPTEALHQLQQITGLSNVDFMDNEEQGEQDLIQLILSRHNQKHLYGINTHLQLPNYTQHSYEIRSQLRGYMVTKIPFTCSIQLGPIISILRQHASAAAFYETFVLHPQRPVKKDDALTFHFLVNIASVDHVHVQFDHPCDVNRTVHLDIEIGPFGVVKTLVNRNYTRGLSQPSNGPANDLVGANEHGVMTLDPTPILTRSHALPIAMVWLFIALECPVHRQLPYRGHPSVPTSDEMLGSVDLTFHCTTPKLLNHLRNMLDRARSNVIIQGATGSGGVLSGADRFAAVDLRAPLLPTLVQAAPGIGTGPPKRPTLPPGVLATPPPVFPHTDLGGTSELMTNMLTTVRINDGQTKSRTNVFPTSPGSSAFNPRALRLDDLLVDNIFQQSLTTPQPFAGQSDQLAAGKIVPTSTMSTSVVGPASQLKSTLAGRDSSAVDPGRLSPVHPPGVGMTGHSSATAYTSKLPNSGVAVPGTFVNRSNPTPSSNLVTPPVSIPGTFTQSSLIVNPACGGVGGGKTGVTGGPSGPSNSKSCSSSSGSMLINLLNEDPLPPPTNSLLPQLPHAQRLNLSSSHSEPLMMGGTFDVSRDNFGTSNTVTPNRIPSVTSIISPSTVGVGVSPSSLGLGRVSSASASSLSASNPPVSSPPPLSKQAASTQSARSMPTAVAHGTGTGMSKSRSTGLVSGPSVGPAVTPVTATSKKPRKRRRGVSDTFGVSSQTKPTSLVSSTPQSSVHVSKHQRLHVGEVAHHRNSFITASGYGCVMTNPAITSPTPGSSVGPTTVAGSGKSVYDFDDTPSSLFEMTSTSSISSFSGPSGTPTSKLSSSGASFSASGSSLLGSSGTGSAILQVSGSGMITTPTIAECTVDRKSSLKMTIKTLPPQTTTPTSKLSVGKQDLLKSPGSRLVTTTEGKIKAAPTGQSIKKRKRRSIEGKPSSYMLQMLQHAIAPTHTAGGVLQPTAGSIKPTKPVTTLSHASLIVKKERKRRANHASEKVVHASGPSQMFAAVSGGHIGHDTDSSKPSKFERLSREDSCDNAVQEKIPSSIHAASPVTPGKSHQMSSSSIKKKHFLTSSSTVTVEDNVSKRSHGSLVCSSAQTAELKRKKHSEPSKQSVSSIPLANNFGCTQYELEDVNNIQFMVADSSQTTTSSAKVPRSSVHSLVRSGSQGIVGPPKKSHTNTTFTSSVTSTMTTTSSNSSGLIKGYKIPKKKVSGTNSAVLKIGLTEERQDSVCTVSSETISPSKAIVSKAIDLNIPDPYSLSDFAPISPLLSTSFSTHPTTSTVCSSQSSHGSNYAKSEFNPPQPSVVTTASMVTSQSGASQLQQLPRRQSMKSIIDIVDKLRAKSSSSTASVPSATQSSSANNLQGFQDSQVRSETDDKANFQDICFVAAPGDRDSAQDPRGDNIFEKFYAGTPTSTSQNEVGRTGTSTNTPVQSTTTTSTTTQSSFNCSPTTDPCTAKQRNVIAVPDETMVTSDPADQTTERSDGTLDDEESADQSVQYDVIKAQTDTPASPTESGTSTISTSTSAASKIIPISPTSAKRLSSSLPHSKTGIRHNNPGSFISRKNPGSVTRFPRPPLGNSGPMPHGIDSYMRSVTGGHLRAGRPARAFQHSLHRPKTASYKGSSSWSSAAVEFGAMGAVNSTAVAGVGGPNDPNNASPMGPWIMSQSGGPPPHTAGSAMPPFPLPHGPLPPHHPFHSGAPKRPMRPPLGSFGPGGNNMYGGPM
ncbi:hypothetical protein EG68_05822 [Paragonimus skrjabini miyazakii]|uniref:Mediator of RNA polymerase II transcription subunit 1 n=1 Tax=Paragonimus skrjabini miyazakii TaxID=59628 RepID=A0A8S9YVT6_9TREM|nr:hypothetical protein EG68_05822 [Paragonimus skrjabini miyazakii]